MKPIATNHPVLGIWLALFAAFCGGILASEVIPEKSQLEHDFPEHVRPLLKNYCFKCHDKDTDTGLDLSALDGAITAQNIEAWTKVKNKLDVGSMPKPPSRRPARNEEDLVLTWIGNSLKRYNADHQETGGDTLVRRINHRAYMNMLQTLLGVPAQGMENFPDDIAYNGYDTVGFGLHTTTYQYECYLNSVQQTLDLALSADPAPPPVKEEHKLTKSRALEDIYKDQVWFARELEEIQADPRRYTTSAVFASVWPPVKALICGAVATHYGQKTFNDVNRRGIIWVSDADCREAIITALHRRLEDYALLAATVTDFQPLFNNGTGGGNQIGPFCDVPVKVNVEAPGNYELSANLCVTDSKYPLPVSVSVDDHLRSRFMVCAPPSAPRRYATTVYFNPGQHRVLVHLCTSQITLVDWINAHYGLNYTLKTHTFAPHPRMAAPSINCLGVTLPAADLLCDGVAIRGPLFDTWPPAAASRILPQGIKAPLTRGYTEEIVGAFMKRACAGNCDAGDIQPCVDMVMTHYEANKDFLAAVKFGLSAVLCSPRFLYLEEEPRTDSTKRKPLNGFELARRLAYFVWSDLPDDALIASASSGALLDSKELLAQTQRMLKDDRSRAFRTAFTTQWLKINKLDSIQPPGELFPSFDPVLLESMKGESIAFFSELLDKNLSVVNFIDSDFAMLNDRMAIHYGIPGIEGNDFRRVALPPGSHRGGVLCQASVLTALSNGMVTSPVRRGVFIMERMLGDSPGVPPPDVPALDKIDPAKADGSLLTPRERLSLHRVNMSCARCHDRIDPLGVGLENYNAFGSWNAKVQVLIPKAKDGKPHWENHEADVRGAMLDGAPFNGAEELKQRLLERKEKLLRTLAENLTIYALGRPLELSDGPVLDKLCGQVAQNGYGLATLVAGIVQSELFRDK